MGKIDIFRNVYVTLRIVQLAHAEGECILQRGGGSDALFPSYLGRTCSCLFKIYIA